RFGVDANIAAGAYDAVHFWAAAVEKAKSFDPDRVALAHEGMCLDNTHIGRQCIRKEDHQVVMDMHLYQVKGGKNLPIARIAGTDSIGEPMVGKDPVEGLTHSFWVAMILAPLSVAALGAVTEIVTLRPIYRREPLYGLILTFGLALVFREGARQIWGGDMRRILPPVTGSTPLLGMTYPN